jgi:hypothetical protein
MPSFSPDLILASDLALMLRAFPGDELIPSNEEVPSVFSNAHVRGIDRKTSRRGLS